jgi:hypothetical protein
MSIIKADIWQNSSGIRQQTILQAQQAIRTDSFTSSVSESWQNIPGLSVVITPSSVNSKILISFSLGKLAGLNHSSFRVTRDGGLFNMGSEGSRTRAHVGDSNQGRDSNHTGSVNFMYVDDPATTSAITYQLQFIWEGTAGVFGLNRTASNTDNALSYNSRTASTLIAMEIAG